MSPSRHDNSNGGGGSFRDLARRAASAAVLACAAITLTWAGSVPFTILCCLGAAILCWEWNRLLRGEAIGLPMWIHGAGAVAACIAVLALSLNAASAILLAATLAVFLVPQSGSDRLWSGLGIFYLGLAPVLLIALRANSNDGLLAILLLFLVVWSADTAAYFAGRAIGGPKLAPAISPGKTWSGCVAGLLAPAVLAAAYAAWLGEGSPMMLGFVGFVLALASQAGDLAESAIKRRFGVKDSGSILPGHGGLFDRVDGLIGATLAAGFIVWCRSGTVSPRALLIW